MSKSHAKRFVRSAWALLSFQLIASIGAVATTGAAALYVSRLAAEVEAARTPPGAAEATDALETETADAGASPPTETTPPDQDAAVEPTPTGPAPEPAAPAPPVQRCGQSTQETYAAGNVNIIRVQANVEWCDTGIVLQQGQTLTIRAQGRWNYRGAPEFGPTGARERERTALAPRAPLGALIGRIGSFMFPIGEGGQFPVVASGPLHLSMNDVSGGFYDNAGYVDVLVQPASDDR